MAGKYEKDPLNHIQITSKVSVITGDQVWQFCPPPVEQPDVTGRLYPVRNGCFSYYNWNDAVDKANRHIRLERMRYANRQNLNLYRGGGH